MNLYFAPLEGIGGYVFRNAQAEYFTKADKYFSPFISPVRERRIRTREFRDVCPENNQNILLVPQILTNDSQVFCQTVRELQEMGYREVNLNLGCPSKTVVTKCRGAGFLSRPDLLDAFLKDIFAQTEVDISVKTRIGMENPEEFPALLEIYNKYDIKELTIHPRVQSDYYKNHPRMEMFQYGIQNSRNPLVYNGDLCSVSDYERVTRSFGHGEVVTACMMGRGVLANPALFGEIRGKERLSKGRFLEFHDKLFSDYRAVLCGDTNVLYKMKELWFYMAPMFTNYEKYQKAIRKATRANDYKNVVHRLFAEQELKADCREK